MKPTVLISTTCVLLAVCVDVKAQQSSSPPSVLGNGTVGSIAMWDGIHPSGHSTLGDSIIKQVDGLIGIGVVPTSPLTVRGLIETTLGGFKFPDGTVQTTAATSGLTSIFHDATLQGNGTIGSPLGILAPLTLNGAAPSILTAINTAEFGRGVEARGGASGAGVRARGGNSSSFTSAGVGIQAVGGDNFVSGQGAVGLSATGGIGGNFGGAGIVTSGGSTQNAGMGIAALGGTAFGGDGGDGVQAYGSNAVGVGRSAGRGIFASGGAGLNGATPGLAGDFEGDVHISGNLTKGGGSFKIDHPLDPENKYLSHSFVESPDMKNIYDGVVMTDEHGDAVVGLPDYLEALNRDFRYQLTVIGAFAQAIVAEKINQNRFRIKTSAPNVEVSWQVTGIRQDAYANKHRIPVEEAKPSLERGTFLHPDAFDQLPAPRLTPARGPRDR